MDIDEMYNVIQEEEERVASLGYQDGKNDPKIWSTVEEIGHISWKDEVEKGTFIGEVLVLTMIKDKNLKDYTCNLQKKIQEHILRRDNIDILKKEIATLQSQIPQYGPYQDTQKTGDW